MVHIFKKRDFRVSVEQKTHGALEGPHSAGGLLQVEGSQAAPVPGRGSCEAHS